MSSNGVRGKGPKEGKHQLLTWRRGRGTPLEESPGSEGCSSEGKRRGRDLLRKGVPNSIRGVRRRVNFKQKTMGGGAPEM